MADEEPVSETQAGPVRPTEPDTAGDEGWGDDPPQESPDLSGWGDPDPTLPPGLPGEDDGGSWGDPDP